jgi:DNA-binding NarL/FixJ family response regulator
MQTITVAIADTNAGRRKKLEQILGGRPGIKVLGSVMNGSNMAAGSEPAAVHAIPIEDAVIKVNRLSPRILFIHLDPSGSESLTLIEALNRECPDTFIVVLTDESVQEERILQALANGARGYLSHEADSSYFLKAVRVVDDGEIWVPRRMLGLIMDKVCADISLWGRGSLDLAS